MPHAHALVGVIHGLILIILNWSLASRLIEASDRNYWQPDAETLAALRQASDELEDRLEGVYSTIPEGATA